MSITEILFWVLSVTAFVSALVVITSKNPVYSVLALIVTIVSLSGHYILLNAQFLFIVNLIVYAGAIMVLFLFVVMLLNIPTEDPPTGYHARIFGGAGPRRVGAVLSLLLVIEFAWAMSKLQVATIPTGVASPRVYDIGLRLFREYAFAFEATSVLILVAMVGAIILARREHRS